MRWVAAWRERLRALIFRARQETELDEELRFHLDQETELLLEAGLDPQEARRQARLRFGGVERFKEEVREARGTGVIDCLMLDTRYAARRLTRDWRFTLPAVLILALGIGANTAMFSVVNRALFQPLPFADADRLVNIYQNVGESSQPWASSYPAYQDMAGYTDLFSGVAASMMPTQVRYLAGPLVRTGSAEYATSNYLEVQGVDLPMGRWFTAEEDRPGAAAVAVLGHQAWTSKFGAAPSVLGQTMRINGVPVTIIGVGPEAYNSNFHSGWVTDFWLPISSVTTVGGRADVLQRRDEDAFLVRARLRGGVSLPQAQAAMTALGAHLAKEYPDDDPGRGISVLRSDEVLVHPQFDTILGAGASILMIVVALILAIACTNLATWLLVRGLSRAKEMSVRLALGATRAQLARHLLVESTVLAGWVVRWVTSWRNGRFDWWRSWTCRWTQAVASTTGCSASRWHCRY